MEALGWGEAKDGQLGLGTDGIETIPVPQPVTALQGKQIEDIGCGQGHSVFVLKDGTVYSCGANEKGQLGHEQRQDQPEQILALETFIVNQVSCGQAHSVVVTDKGKALSWGQDDRGQCGLDLGDRVEKRKPRILKSISPHFVVQVACGSMHTLILTRGGKIFSWGDNQYGQLGMGDKGESSDKPVELKSLHGLPIVQIASGGFHCLTLTCSGTIFGWGKNNFGQLGLGDCERKVYPTLLKNMRNQKVQYISCGQDHSVMLTLEGGVFTCGLGADGQLGHNQHSNELNPRKVFEIMGKRVTQIACGRHHTLAFDASQGRLFSFGLGNCGQLGRNENVCQSHPVPSEVRGCWQSYPPKDNQVSICAIYTGGNHCFCLVSSRQNSIPPLDYREYPSQKRTSMLDDEFISRIVDSVFNEDIKKQIQDVFSSASCLNGSFLKKNNGHFGSSRQNHGVDLDVARAAFSKLHIAKAKVHFTCICSVMQTHLFPSLPSSPPDIEALRLYILLMEFPLHEDSKVPFPVETVTMLAKCLNNLKTTAAKVLLTWWSTFQPRHLKKVVNVYQRCVVEQLKAKQPMENIFLAMQVLKKLNTVNDENHEIIPFNFFYIANLGELLDLRHHFVIWFQKDPSVPFPFTFCDFPFVFDVLTKSQLFQVDALIQMQIAVDQTHQSNLYQLMVNQQPIGQLPYLVLHVDRKNIVSSTVRELAQVLPQDCKKPLKIVFQDEDAMDAGGVKKEFFMLIMKEILDPKYGMFTYYEESRFVWFNRTFFEDETMFRLVGILCGLAIYNHTIVSFPFPPLLYKKLLNRRTTLEDFKHLEPTVGKHLQTLLEYEGDDVEDVFCLSFEYSDTVFGAVQTRELIEGGSNIPVTSENKEKYVECLVNFMVDTSVEKQFNQFKSGFMHVCGGRALDFCHPDELQAMIVGDESYDWEEFEKSAVYKGEYWASHDTIKLFWKVFRELGLDLKKKFLVFLTGSDRVPIEGMKSLQPAFQPVKTGPNYYPVAHTCFNLLDLPQYKNEEELREKLLAAIAHAVTGFTIV